MLSSLTSGVTGLDSFQEQMNVIGNNIANLNTTGYKAATVDFADAFSNILGTQGGANPVQVGTGVSITGINNNWAQGTVSATGIQSDLAVNGNGFFLVKDPATGDTYATRDGSFTIDPNGFLVNDSGDRVQGFTDGTLSTLGDIKIDTTGSTSTAPMSSYSINSSGQITVTQTDGTSFTRGQVLLQNFEDPQKLINAGNNLFTNLTAAGELAAPSAPGTVGLGSVSSGSLELSNVDLSSEMANLITAQRAFEANSKIITTSDETLDTVVNMKR